MTLRHIVLLTLADDASAAQRDAIVDALRELPAMIPELRSYVVGADAGINEGNADIAVVADFDDVDGYRTYVSHAEHVRVIETLIGPVLRARSAVQHEVP